MLGNWHAALVAGLKVITWQDSQHTLVNELESSEALGSTGSGEFLSEES